MFRSFSFVFRIAAAWAVSVLAVLFVLAIVIDRNEAMPPFMLLGLAIVVFATVGAISYTSRVRFMDEHAGNDALTNRQRRRIEVPFEAEETLDLVDAVIRELPGAEEIQSQPSGLRIRARVRRPETYGHGRLARLNPVKWFSRMPNQVLATVTPGDDASTVTLVCEPEANTWTDWFLIDGGTNLENANAITQALTHRVAARCRDEHRAAERTATEKELSEARLSLLHAQIEPHFLYNTLASAQLLTRSNPPQADRMLGHLIQYLRNALPHIGESQSTLAEELERIRAYLEVLRVRMGERLAMQIEVPDDLLSTPVPTMMLQPLVENAIKHGLEPKSGGGTIWILARRDDGKVAITVADDGQGFGASSGGTGIGLKNVRERLRLLYGSRASLSVVANAPAGVSATLTVPAAATAGMQPEAAHD